MHRILCAGVLFIFALNSYAWNALGHQLVAQIAYDKLTPKAKLLCDQYNDALNSLSPSPDFVSSAAWFDQIRGDDIHWYDTFHYIDIPFSKDKTRLPKVEHVNALWAMKQAISVLSSKKSSLADKGFSLRVLIHVVGDVHQPLHTVTKISRRLPKGDLGGNLFLLSRNPIGRNLHEYWDNGGGILIGQSKNFQVKNKALQLEKQWSCEVANSKMKPQQWIKDSHELALTQVYALKSHKAPSKRYQLNAQNITQKQILLAGCRLAALLNNLENKQNQGVG